MSRYFKVAHNFKAEEDVELTVYKGEFLFSHDSVVQDGWIKVQTLGDKARSGFVPFTYLREIEESDLPAGAASAAAAAATNSSSNNINNSNNKSATRSSAQNSPGTSRNIRGQSPSGQVSSPRREPNPVSAINTPQQTPPRNNTSRVSGTSPAAPALYATSTHEPSFTAASATSAGAAGAAAAATSTSAPQPYTTGADDAGVLVSPEIVSDAVLKNELRYKQLMRQRAEALSSLQVTLEEAMTEVAACKDKKAALSRKLKELDDSVETERTRWLEKLEEERGYIQRAAPASGSSQPNNGSMLPASGESSYV